MKRHQHSGRSSSTFLDYKKIIQLSDIKKDSKIIDIGCGYGDFAIELVKSSNPELVYAIDIFKEGIEHLIDRLKKENITKIIPLNQDFTQKPNLPKNLFDIAFMINVMHGFFINGEIEQVFYELNRILKSDGRIIVVDFKKTIPFFGPPISERISSRELHTIAQRYGYTHRATYNIKFTHYLTIIKRENAQT